jgi:hypothetical protein
MVILFADVLGAKARWHKGGREEAEKFFVLFRNLVISTLKRADIAPPREGAIETDALTLVYETAEQAIYAAMVLYQAAFDSARTPTRDRLWLRGAIVPYASGEPLRRLRPISAPLEQVSLFLYAAPFFDAISVEKSGFRGMRMLIDSELVTRQVSTTFRHPIGERSFIPLKRLNHSQYPGRITSAYHDVLWMFSPDQAVWGDRKRLMSCRLRWSGNEPEEFIQAAATQLVFSECQAILTTLHERRPRRQRRAG